MWKTYALILCLLLPVMAAGQETEKLTCTVKVVDAKAQPVLGAEVVACERIWDTTVGQIRVEVLDKTKSGADGLAVLKLNVARKRSEYFLAARKKGLALGWERLKPKVTLILGEPFVLAGTVVDENDKPISRAQVRVHTRYSWLSGLMNLVMGELEDWFTAEIDANGRFSFDNIPSDVTSDFLAEAPGKASVCTSPPLDGFLGWGLAAGRTNIRVVLPPEAKIQGRIVDAEGNGVAGVRLLARPINLRAKMYCPDTILSEQGGRFCFRGLEAGAYSLQVVLPREGLGEWVGKEIKVITKAGQTTDGVTMEVGKGAVLDMIVRERTTKRAIPDVWVYVGRRSRFSKDNFAFSGFQNVAMTDSNGVVSMRAPLGQCRISAVRKGYSIHSEAYIVEGDNSPLEILLDVDSRVSGTVYDEAGKPVIGATVDVLPRSSGAVQTDSTGRFEVGCRGARGGDRMYVLARCPERNLAALSEVKDESHHLKVRLEPASSLSGRVTDPDDAPIPAASVRLLVDLPFGWVHAGFDVITDTRGHYEIKAIPPEREDFSYYCIQFVASAYGPLKLSEFPVSDASQRRTELEPFVLPPANLSISGTVVDANDKPVPEMPVFSRGSVSDYGQPRRHILTNAKGEFSFNKVCRGPLRLQAGGYGTEPGFLHAEGGDQNVKIVLGQKRVHTGHASLLNKPIPDFTNIKIEFGPEQAKGKAILVCFWDMNQRPSRYTVRELAKRAEELKGKGVVVVGVQASKVDEKALNEWVEKYKIPFPVGMVAADEEKTRLAWGVKSLPWLILTDRKHIVIATGFALGELHEKTKGIP